MTTEPSESVRTPAAARAIAARAFERTGRRPKVTAIQAIGGGVRWVVADPEGVAA